MNDATSTRRESWVPQLPLILTGTAALVVSLRLLVVATWSRRTALAILQSGGTAQVVTGVLVSTIGTAGGSAVGLYLLVRILLLTATRRRPGVVDAVVGMVAIVLELIVVPLYLVPITALLLVLAWVVGIRLRGRLASSGRDHEDQASIARLVAGTGMALAILIIVLIDNRPWLPPENVTFESGAVVTGYVLASDDADLTVLVGRRPRTVAHYLEPKVEKREICGGLSKWWDVPVLHNLLGLTPYPPCAQDY